MASNAPETSLVGRYYFGQRVPVTLTATQPGAVAFTYRFEAEDGQPEHTVPVDADGNAAVSIDIPRGEVTAFDFLVLTEPGWHPGSSFPLAANEFHYCSAMATRPSQLWRERLAEDARMVASGGALPGRGRRVG